jgi:hypothetical protein
MAIHSQRTLISAEYLAFERAQTDASATDLYTYPAIAALCGDPQLDDSESDPLCLEAYAPGNWGEC